MCFHSRARRYEELIEENEELIEGNEEKGQKDQKADGTCLSPSLSSVLLQLIFLT